VPTRRAAKRRRPAAFRLSRTARDDIVESPAERGPAVCNLFVSQDPATYAAETRSVRLHGHVTSIRLETAFWTILEEIAGHEGISVARFVSVLHDEILDRNGEVPNFASFLRVACLHWARNQNLHAAQVAERGGSVEPDLAAEKLRATA
jgi:predicted DNA-binding ribbon-helix-helix protein